MPKTIILQLIALLIVILPLIGHQAKIIDLSKLPKGANLAIIMTSFMFIALGVVFMLI